MRNSANPELSIVVASRNDDHGRNLLHRMQVFIDALLALCYKYRLNWELLVVEWNPPLDAKRLADELIWPTYRDAATVRFIEVPPGLHARLPYADRFPLPQFEAKNVGIRRARGQYILATNFDIVFSEELIANLSSEKLSPDCFYRVFRYDVENKVPLGLPVEDQLQFCAKNAVRKYALNGTQEVKEGTKRFQPVRDILKLIEKVQQWRTRDNIYTNACGDFTLMLRRQWHDLRGYPEIGSHAYTDGLICYMAASKGLRQVILRDPMCIYHQEHDLGFGDLMKKSHATQPPMMDYQQYRRCCIEMLRSKQPKIFNDEGWGLGGETLVERVVIV